MQRAYAFLSNITLLHQSVRDRNFSKSSCFLCYSILCIFYCSFFHLHGGIVSVVVPPYGCHSFSCLYYSLVSFHMTYWKQDYTCNSINNKSPIFIDILLTQKFKLMVYEEWHSPTKPPCSCDFLCRA